MKDKQREKNPNKTNLVILFKLLKTIENYEKKYKYDLMHFL